MKKYICLLIFVILVYAYYSFQSKPPVSKQEAIVMVKVQEVKSKDLPLITQTLGYAQPQESVAVKTRVDSQITEVTFKGGDMVSVGQVLFKLDDRVIRAQLAQAEANYKAGQVQLENLRKQLNRTKGVEKSGYDTAQSLDNAQSAYDAQLANLEAIKANIDALHVQLDYTIITAPINGKTSSIDITLGNNVKAADNTPLVTINQLSPIEIKFSLPQKYLQYFNPLSEEVEIRDANATLLKFSRLENSMDSLTNTFTVYAIHGNEQLNIWPNMYLDIVVTLKTFKGVKVIPVIALVKQETKDYVYLAKGNTASRCAVELGEGIGEEIIITKGLEEGEQVIIDGILNLTEGSKIGY